MIFGIGTDITEIDRIESMIERHGDLFLNRTYTATEIAYCAGHKNASQHYAGRWAAKEAIMKSLGTGFTKGINWKDLEILPMPTGKPIVTLTGGAARLCQELGITTVMISISHCKTYATATAIAMLE